MRAFLALVVSLVSFGWIGVANAQMPNGFADLVEKLSPAVVNISTTQKIKNPPVMMPGIPFEGLPNTPEFEPFRQFFDRFGQMQGQPSEREVTSLGSGFIIDAKGYVITNNHVIDDADDITVTVGTSTKYKAKLVGRDKKVDLALLKIEAKKDLPFVVMGDSDPMRVGDWVIAIGNPFGLGGSVTQGIISARERSINAGPFDDFLQTDAPINRGNSGGPLFNTKGEVIGINTAIFSPSGGSIGIGFAIPTALAKPVIEQLKQFGRTHRGWLGVKIQEVSDDVAESIGLDKAKGALVLEVSKGSPAEKAGIKEGDIITSFDGRDIAEMRFLPRAVAETKIGKSVPITYWRSGAAKTTQVTIGELEEAADGSDVDAPLPNGKNKDAEAMLGLQIAPLTPVLRNKVQLNESVQGAIIVGVSAGAEAVKRGVRPGDVIVDISGVAVASPADVKKAVAEAKKQGRRNVLMKLLRGANTTLFIAVPLAEEKPPQE